MSMEPPNQRNLPFERRIVLDSSFDRLTLIRIEGVEHVADQVWFS